MATDYMKQLIDETIGDEEMNDALIDITEFKLGMLNKFNADDIFQIEDAGFNFVSRSLTQRKQELRSFITGHPALMSGDFETMIDKIMFYLSRQRREKAKKRQRRQQRTKAIKEKYFKDSSEYEQDEPDDAQSTHSKSSKKVSKPEKQPEE